jgi:nicotinamide-nucleotide amidase
VSDRRAVVGVVSVGDELLAGAHPDLNGPYLAGRMAEFGRRVERVHVVGDDEAAIAEAVEALAATSSLVFVSGGLGPTLDDVTRHGVARALGAPLEECPAALEEIERWFTRAGRVMLDNNRRQALVPAGAARIPNAFGTAPGFRGRHPSGAEVVVLPGPPRELQGVFVAEVEGWLRANRPDALHRARASASFVDLPESTFADAAGAWLERGANPLVGVTVKDGILTTRAVATADSPEEAERLARGRVDELRALFPDRYLAERVDDLGAFVGEELRRLGVRFSLAESCTGGLAAASLTSAPGVSEVFERSFVTYANEAKQQELGVPGEVLREHGAVSEACARAMALGALERSGADLAVAITGVAGPGGGTEEKPVGLVWFGVAVRDEGGGAPRVEAEERRWPPLGRARVRRWAANRALAHLLRVARARAV